MDHQRRVLAGALPHRKDNLLYLFEQLEPVHFTTDILRNLFLLLERYYDVAGGVLPATALSDLMARSQKVDASKALLYEQTYTELAATTIEDHEFRYSIDALKEQRTHQLTGEAFATGFEILERGLEVGKDFRQGAAEARSYFLSKAAEIDKLAAADVSPEGDMRHEAAEILADYEARKNGTTGLGVGTGISTLDKTTSGFQKGELAMVCAFTNSGKSQMCCQIAWHAAIKQGVNVFFATSETVRATIRRRIVARHSREPQFGLKTGLNSDDLKRGSLSPVEEKALAAVVKDLDTNPNYGRIYLAQIPRGATMTYFEARMARQAAQYEVGLGIMDYLALLRSDTKRQSEREEFNDIIKSAKVFATSFNEGQGVPLITPWQIRRESYQEALRTGSYGLASLSDTSEAEKSADAILALLRLPDNPHQISLQYLKLRDGEIPGPTSIDIDFRNAYFADKGKASFASTGYSANLEAYGI